MLGSRRSHVARIAARCATCSSMLKTPSAANSGASLGGAQKAAAVPRRPEKAGWAKLAALAAHERASRLLQLQWCR